MLTIPISARSFIRWRHLADATVGVETHSFFQMVNCRNQVTTIDQTAKDRSGALFPGMPPTIGPSFPIINRTKQLPGDKGDAANPERLLARLDDYVSSLNVLAGCSLARIVARIVEEQLIAVGIVDHQELVAPRTLLDRNALGLEFRA
jgi:hypothetical protein